jgi:hypothetical protein
MNADRERIERAHAARLAAQSEEEGAIMETLRNRSVPQAEIARIAGVSTETIRQMRIAAGIPGDGKKVRGKLPGLIYAFRDEEGTWWPHGHEHLLPNGYVVMEMKIRGDRPSRFAGQKLVAMCALEADALPDDSPNYVYQVSGSRGRRTTKAVHDEIWRVEGV